jgi:subtilisin family serine protease
MSRNKSLLILLGLGLLASARPVFADGIVPGYVLAEPVAGADINAIAADYGVTIEDRVSGTAVVALSIPAGSTEESFSTRLASDPRLVFAETDTYLAHIEVKGNPVHLAFDSALSDPIFLAQWSAPIGTYSSGSPLLQIDLGSVQKRTTGAGVTVAVLDTGVDDTHALLQGHVYAGFNMIDPAAPPLDAADGLNNSAVGHGTMVSGIILRVAPDARILPIRVLNGDGLGSAIDVSNGVMTALRNGARVVNMSLGSSVRSKTLDEAMNAAETAGVTVVTAAGNGGVDAVQYPTSRANVLVVASVEADNTKSPFSNYGKRVSYVAPGSGIRSTYLNGGFASWSGTSFAAPFVSGEAALILALHPEFTSNGVKSAIGSGAQSVDNVNPLYKGFLGKGIIDIERTIKKL